MSVGQIGIAGIQIDVTLHENILVILLRVQQVK